MARSLTIGNLRVIGSTKGSSFTGSFFSGSFIGDGTEIEGVLFDNIADKPTLVSSSIQIDHDQTTNFEANEHFTQADITEVGTVITGNVDAILPSNLISSSLQFNNLTSPFTGSFTGSFTGDGSGLTGIGSVTSIETTEPLTGGPITDTGTIGITQATTSTDGYLSSTDWNTFNDKTICTGTVTSVTSGDTDTITIGGTLTDPTVAANTAAILDGGTNLATGDQIYDHVTTRISGLTDCTGTVTNVTAGEGMTQTGTSTDNTTLNIGAGTAITVNADNIEVTAACNTAWNAKTDCIGTVTSVGGTGTVAGITLSGTVNESGNLTLGGTFSTTTSSISDFDTGVGIIIDGCGFTTGTSTITGTGISNQIATWNTTSELDGSSNLTFDGNNLYVGGTLEISSNNTSNNLKLTSTDTTTAGAPDLVLFADAAAQDGDTLGTLLFQGKNGMVPSSTSPLSYVGFFAHMADTSSNHSVLALTMHKGNGAGAQNTAMNFSLIGTDNYAEGALHINPPSGYDFPTHNLEVNGTTKLAGSTTIGISHTNNGTYSFIGGGVCNTVESKYDSILGGDCNSIINTLTGYTNVGRSSIVGGCCNVIDGTRGWNFIAGGYNNTISGSVCGFDNYANVILGRSSLIDACDRNSITGGGSNIISGSISNSNIAGGVSNCITGATSTVGGGAGNDVLSSQSIIGGGTVNVITNSYSTIGGGTQNTIESTRSGILGGISNCITHSDSFAIGSNLTSSAACTTFMNNLDVEGTVSGSIFSGSFVGDGSGLTGISGGSGTVTGTGANNQIATWNTTSELDGSSNFTFDGTTLVVDAKLTVGSSHTNNGTLSTIAGGTSNVINTGAHCSFIGGGLSNEICASSQYSTISGGGSNTASGAQSTVGGGTGNCAETIASSILGGQNNTASGQYSTISGGYGNRASGNYSGVLGGVSNIASGVSSGILGGSNNNTNSCAKSFIIGSNLTSTAACTTFMNSGSFDGYVDVVGDVTAANFVLSSDESLKESIQDLDVTVDAKWKSYKFKDSNELRYGVVAQELEKTNPELIRANDRGLKSVAYIDLLIAKVAELEARLDKAGL